MSIKDYDVSLHLNVIESAILKLAKPYLQIRDNERHTLNAIEFALKLQEIYDAERMIVIPAMILHDVGWSKVSQDIISKACRPHPVKKLIRIHEKESVKLAAGILKDIGYDITMSAAIVEIINGHDTRSIAVSTNDKIVKDSDKLTRCAKSFWFWTQQLPMVPRELADTLEETIEEWFFLDKSKEIAKEELKQRRMEERELL
jgi:HD superfamily phosphohydrolase YqeK